MKNTLLYIGLALTLASGICSCSDETIYAVVDNQPQPSTYRPIDYVTSQINNNQLGNCVSDENYDYLQYYEADRLKLYRRERATGQLTQLTEIRDVTKGTDALFCNFSLKGDYLYFILFNGNDPDRRNVLCRVRTDGRGLMESICNFGLQFGSIHYVGDNTYVKLYGSGSEPGTFARLDPETGETTPLFNTDKTTEFVYDGYVYSHDYYNQNGKFYVQLYRCRLDGTQSELVWDDPDCTNFRATIWNGKLCLADIYNNTVYLADADGKNRRVLLEDTRVVSMNAYYDNLYFYTEGGTCTAGLYLYKQGYDRPMLLAAEPNFNIGPIVNSHGEVWFTLPTEESANSRFGQLHYVDTKHRLCEIK